MTFLDYGFKPPLEQVLKLAKPDKRLTAESATAQRPTAVLLCVRERETNLVPLLTNNSVRLSIASRCDCSRRQSGITVVETGRLKAVVGYRLP